MIKLRIGFDDSERSRDDFWDICRRVAAIGPDAVCIHGRTVAQLYRGKADWSVLAEVKRKYPHLTLIGSGDIMTAESVVERLTSSGLDGVVIARGAVGNPWIFRDARALVEGNPLPPPPDLPEQAAVLADHLRMVLQLKPEHKGLMYFRKFAAGYSRHHPNRKTVQLELMAAKSRLQIEQAIHKHYLSGQ
jgi:tRNA-dihydrouridine synthase B